MSKFWFVVPFIMCFAASGCKSEEPISAYDVNGSYILYDNPYSEGYAEVTPTNAGNVHLSVTTYTPGGRGICQWEGEVTPSKKPQKTYEQEKSEKYVEVGFGDDLLNIGSNYDEMCGMGAELAGTFLKVGSPAYNEAMKIADQIPVFENIIDGNIISYKVDKEKYTLELDRNIETFTISGRTSDPLFEQIEHTMKWAKIYNENALPEHFTVAILQSEGANCGFVQIRSDEIYIRGFNARPDKVIVDMCIAESSDCRSLRVSQNNPVFCQVEEYLAQNLEKTVDATYSTGGEILGMSTRQHVLHGTWNINIDETINASPELKIQSDSNPMAKDTLKSMLGDFTIRIDMQRFMLSGKLAGNYLGDQKFAVSKQEGSRMVITADDGASMDMRLIDAQTLEIKDPQQGMLLIFKKSL